MFYHLVAVVYEPPYLLTLIRIFLVPLVVAALVRQVIRGFR